MADDRYHGDKFDPDLSKEDRDLIESYKRLYPVQHFRNKVSEVVRRVRAPGYKREHDL